jgi:hypothetical protein
MTPAADGGFRRPRSRAGVGSSTASGETLDASPSD